MPWEGIHNWSDPDTMLIAECSSRLPHASFRERPMVHVARDSLRTVPPATEITLYIDRDRPSGYRLHGPRDGRPREASPDEKLFTERSGGLLRSLWAAP